MRKWLGLAAGAAGLAFIPAAAGASSDYGCQGGWSLEAQTFNCDNLIVLRPGNDTRVNMLLLLHEQGGELPALAAPAADEYMYEDYGQTFFDWDLLVRRLYPSEPRDYSDHYGTLCQSVEQGGADFMAAVDRNRRINPADRARLAEGREALLSQCRSDLSSEQLDRLGMPRQYAGLEAREFGTYIMGASAFYAQDWRSAKSRFAALRNARDPWLREAAAYMEARNALAEAAAPAENEWGWFDIENANAELAQRANAMLEAYLEAYPQGRYAASARGLQRRADWLAGNAEQRGARYAAMLQQVDAGTEAAVSLVEEIDNKFLFAENARDGLTGPVLLATADLLRMRGDPGEDAYLVYGLHSYQPLTAEELAGQEAAFAGQPELYSFLQANHAFYVAEDYRRVLQLLPDDARRTSYSPLQFSRQVLRGMALARLGDRNEVGFWRELIEGTDGLYQRPTVELGLALAWERAGQVAQVFAPGSPVHDARIRAILLEHSAGPDVLRAVAGGTGLTQDERDLAAYVLLYRELSRGEYAAARRDLSLARASAPTTPYDEETYVPQTPAGVYLSGRFTDEYACPALRDTLARLERNARDVQGRLCLGEFYRLNNFDVLYLDWGRPEATLGSYASYPGEPAPRSAIYDAIMAERGVSRNDRAYALYRAIRCYAPSGNSSCGGEQVPEATRAAWFRRLKGEFADTRWAQELEYYW